MLSIAFSASVIMALPMPRPASRLALRVLHPAGSTINAARIAPERQMGARRATARLAGMALRSDCGGLMVESFRGIAAPAHWAGWRSRGLSAGWDPAFNYLEDSPLGSEAINSLLGSSTRR